MPKRKPTVYLPPITHAGTTYDYDSDTSLTFTYDDSFIQELIHVEIHNPAHRHRVRVHAHEIVSVLQRICPHLEITFKPPAEPPAN